MCDLHIRPPHPAASGRSGRHSALRRRDLYQRGDMPTSVKSSRVFPFCRPGVNAGDLVIQTGSLISVKLRAPCSCRGKMGTHLMYDGPRTAGINARPQEAESPFSGWLLKPFAQIQMQYLKCLCLECWLLIGVFQMVTNHPWSMDF